MTSSAVTLPLRLATKSRSTGTSPVKSGRDVAVDDNGEDEIVGSVVGYAEIEGESEIEGASDVSNWMQ